MITLARWIFSLVVAVAAVLFALGNRADVVFVWSPLHDPVTLPVFVPVLAALLAGFVLGGITVWLNGHAVRAAHRRQRKDIARLEEELRDAVARPQPPAPGSTHE